MAQSLRSRPLPIRPAQIGWMVPGFRTSMAVMICAEICLIRSGIRLPGSRPRATLITPADHAFAPSAVTDFKTHPGRTCSLGSG